MKEIVLAGGCFWGVEEYMRRIDGVLETEVGYANGHKDHPTYEEVCRHTTGHAEAVRIQYDPEALPLPTLLERFWRIIDPTAWNRQGPDIGEQYRTGIYYLDEGDRPAIEQSKALQQQQYEDPIRTEIEPLRVFWKAEDYHQKYLQKNPGGYCHIDLSK